MGLKIEPWGSDPSRAVAVACAAPVDQLPNRYRMGPVGVARVVP